LVTHTANQGPSFDVSFKLTPRTSQRSNCKGRNRSSLRFVWISQSWWRHSQSTSVETLDS